MYDNNVYYFIIANGSKEKYSDTYCFIVIQSIFKNVFDIGIIF